MSLFAVTCPRVFAGAASVFTCVLALVLWPGGEAPGTVAQADGPGKSRAKPPSGGGDQVPAVLTGTGSGTGQGPGITVVAGGAFSLYLNGRLLAKKGAGGEPTFVPLTFLPGKNVVAVLASKGTAAPGALVQIDELERPYVSGPGWKVASTLAGNWMDKTIDDSTWQDAVVVGDTTKVPVNGLPDGAALGPSARWIWSARRGDRQVGLRFTFTIRAQGFAQDVTGGEGGRLVTARSAEEIIKLLQGSQPLIILVPEGVYDFRQVRKDRACANPNDPKDPSKGFTYRIPVGPNDFGCAPGAKKVDVLRWDRRIAVKCSNRTVLGMGRGAHLRGASFNLYESRNVIFRNLCVYDVNPHLVEAGDGISFDRSEGAWVDHCTTRWISDGNDLDDDRAVTYSWLHLNGANQFVYGGKWHYAAAVKDSEVTYHHVWWDNVNGRAPKASGTKARVHVFNNYYTDNTYFEVGSGDGAQVLVEGSSFQGVRFPTVRERGGLIQTRGNSYANITGGHQLNRKTVPEPNDAVFTPPYRYTSDAVGAVPALLRSRAGVGGKWGRPPVY